MPGSAKTIKMGAPPSLAAFPFRAIRRLLGECAGIAAVEFAMLLSLAVASIFMIAQIGLYFYFSTTLYYVTQKATRQILIGAVANQGLTAAQFQTQIYARCFPAACLVAISSPTFKLFPHGVV